MQPVRGLTDVILTRSPVNVASVYSASWIHQVLSGWTTSPS